MIRCAVLLFLFLSTLPARAVEDMHLTVEIDSETGAAPYAGEMVNIAIRGRYRLPITLEQIEQPSLADFDWMQLGSDIWGEDRDRGLRVVTFERRMALYPMRAGTLEIGSFRHVLQLARPNGERYARTILSEPVRLKVLPVPESAHWWFPLRRIGIDDEWSNAPQGLARDQSALRKIVLTVEGTLPEMLPPMPMLTGAGVAILPHPERRRTLLRPGGPVTQVFWRWTIRPDAGGVGYVDPLTLAYFDTSAREMREITLAAQRVAFADASIGGGTARGDAAAPSLAGGEGGVSIPAIPIWAALLFGMVCGAVWLAPRGGRDGGAVPWRRGWGQGLRRWGALLIAGVRRDDRAARRALSALRDGGAGPWVERRLARIDARLYARPSSKSATPIPAPETPL